MEKDIVTFNNSRILNQGISNIHIKCTEKEPKNETFTIYREPLDNRIRIRPFLKLDHTLECQQQNCLTMGGGVVTHPAQPIMLQFRI